MMLKFYLGLYYIYIVTESCRAVKNDSIKPCANKYVSNILVVVFEQMSMDIAHFEPCYGLIFARASVAYVFSFMT